MKVELPHDWDGIIYAKAAELGMDPGKLVRHLVGEALDQPVPAIRRGNKSKVKRQTEWESRPHPAGFGRWGRPLDEGKLK